jgi:hypothetical protein
MAREQPTLRRSQVTKPDDLARKNQLWVLNREGLLRVAREPGDPITVAQAHHEIQVSIAKDILRDSDAVHGPRPQPPAPPEK